MKYEKFHDWIFTSTDQLKEDRFYDDFKKHKSIWCNSKTGEKTIEHPGKKYY